MYCFSKDQDKKQEAWTKKKDEKAPGTKDDAKPSGKSDGQWSPGVKEAEPTPRPDRISHDYAQEFPSVEVGSRRVVKKAGGVRESIDQVKLQEEEVSVCGIKTGM